MKHWARIKNQRAIYIGSFISKPHRAAVQIPPSIPREDFPYLRSDLTVDVQRKKADNDAIKLESDLGQLYKDLVGDVYTEMTKIFLTNNDISAIATRETWKDMVEFSSEYVDKGLMSPELLLSAETSVLFGPGDLLNTPVKIEAYASRKLAQARDYGIWRLQRISAFRADKKQRETQEL